VIHPEPGFTEKAFGLAVDIGTTTVAAYLCDLNTGEILAMKSMVNPQVVYGEDAISRITYTMAQQDGLKTLNQAVIGGLNQMVRDITFNRVLISSIFLI